MNAKLIGAVGLVFDILGAAFFAIDLFRAYDGNTIIQGTQTDITPPEEHPLYAKHKKQNRYLMKVGFVFLIIGFIFQVLAIWMR